MIRAEAEQLKLFLATCRARIEPATIGLPHRRNGRGLRRDDIAELLGVTPLWYSLFESGTSNRRFSAAFVDGVARALQLDALQCATLLRLVIVAGTASQDLYDRATSSQLCSALMRLPAFMHYLAMARSVHEIGSLASRTFTDLLGSSQPTVSLFDTTKSTLLQLAYDRQANIDYRCRAAAVTSAIQKGSAIQHGDRRQTFLCVPLMTAGTAIGALCIHSPLASAFYDADHQIAEVLAQQTARAMRQLRAFDRYEDLCEA